MEKKRVLVLSPIKQEIIEGLFKIFATPEEMDNIQIVICDGKERDTLIEEVSKADVIIGDYTNNVEMDTQVIKAARNCLLIHQPSTGFQHIDIIEASRQGIPVANAAWTNTGAVAEHTIMLILACLKKLILAHQKTTRGEWAQEEMAFYGVYELEGKILGIIGMGRIGKEVARRALAFRCEIIYYDKSRIPQETEKELGVKYVELDELIQTSDVITIHTPLTAETKNLISAERIALMKPNTILINVSRGAIMDENAVAESLRNGHLAGAGIDVFSREPIDKSNPLLKAPNVILTPHIAGATNESRLRIITMAIKNVLAVLRGEKPINVVNDVQGLKGE